MQKNCEAAMIYNVKSFFTGSFLERIVVKRVN